MAFGDSHGYYGSKALGYGNYAYANQNPYANYPYLPPPQWLQATEQHNRYKKSTKS